MTGQVVSKQTEGALCAERHLMAKLPGLDRNAWLVGESKQDEGIAAETHMGTRPPFAKEGSLGCGCYSHGSLGYESLGDGSQIQHRSGKEVIKLPPPNKVPS